MALTLTNYTLTYSPDERVMGWPSFYSYHPDWMIGMNNTFYTFYGGDIYQHNANPTRNRFYDVNYNSTVKTVFNTSPLENKLYKTIALQGTDSWSALLQTDIQLSNTVATTSFVKKEQVWFAYVRNEDTAVGSPNYSLRSVNGIGSTNDISGPFDATLIKFPLTVNLGGINGTPVAVGNVGDMLYYGTSPTALVGQITAVTINLQAGDNYLTVDTTAGAVPPAGTHYFLYVKNPLAESHGVLGHYCTVELTNSLTTQVELFAAQSEVMKSYP